MRRMLRRGGVDGLEPDWDEILLLENDNIYDGGEDEDDEEETYSEDEDDEGVEGKGGDGIGKRKRRGDDDDDDEYQESKRREKRRERKRQRKMEKAIHRDTEIEKNEKEDSATPPGFPTESSSYLPQPQPQPYHHPYSHLHGIVEREQTDGFPKAAVRRMLGHAGKETLEHISYAESRTINVSSSNNGSGDSCSDSGSGIGGGSGSGGGGGGDIGDGNGLGEGEGDDVELPDSILPYMSVEQQFLEEEKREQRRARDDPLNMDWNVPMEVPSPCNSDLYCDGDLFDDMSDGEEEEEEREEEEEEEEEETDGYGYCMRNVGQVDIVDMKHSLQQRKEFGAVNHQGGTTSTPESEARYDDQHEKEHAGVEEDKRILQRTRRAQRVEKKICVPITPTETR